MVKDKTIETIDGILRRFEAGFSMPLELLKDVIPDIEKDLKKILNMNNINIIDPQDLWELISFYKNNKKNASDIFSILSKLNSNECEIEIPLLNANLTRDIEIATNIKISKSSSEGCKISIVMPEIFIQSMDFSKYSFAKSYYRFFIFLLRYYKVISEYSEKEKSLKCMFLINNSVEEIDHSVEVGPSEAKYLSRIEIKDPSYEKDNFKQNIERILKIIFDERKDDPQSVKLQNTMNFYYEAKIIELEDPWISLALQIAGFDGLLGDNNQNKVQTANILSYAIADKYEEREKIRNTFVNAYDARNSFVHGKKPDKKQSNQNRHELTLHVFKLRDYLERLIVKEFESYCNSR